MSNEPPQETALSHTETRSPARAHDASGFPNQRTLNRRTLFWENVVRDTLMAMSAAAAHSGGRLGTGASDAVHSGSPVHEMFDGRMGVITALGQRIPIADVFPVFACSTLSCPHDTERSQDVQCSVFRITTPSGEIYTLPVSQIISVHTLSQDLLDRLSEESGASMGSEQEDDKVPFGFAAYTSLARSESNPSDDPNPLTPRVTGRE